MLFCEVTMTLYLPDSRRQERATRPKPSGPDVAVCTHSMGPRTCMVTAYRALETPTAGNWS